MKKTGQNGRTHLEIFKVQLPLMTTDPEPKALAYNRTESCMFDITVSKELVKRFHGETKLFFWITWTERKDGSIGVDMNHEAPWQEW